MSVGRRLITLSGVDCAGKSTQLERLAERLARDACDGRPVVTLWHRPGYSRWLNEGRRLVRRLRPGALPTASEPQARQAAFERPLVRAAWVGTALLDATVHYALVVRTHLAAGRWVLCDRTIADATLDLTLRFPERAAEITRAASLIEALAPRPSVSLLLTLPWAEVLRRAAEKAEPFPDPPSTRRRRYEAYVDLARSGAFTVIDGTDTIDAVAETIWKAVVAQHRRGVRRPCG